jgi:hypothetical protein
MDFKPSKADPDIWMKNNGKCYEYVCCYVDDLIAIMADPKAFFQELEKQGFGLKGVTSAPEMFLGGSIGRDADGTLHWGAKRYIVRSMEAFERIIGEKPTTRTVPLPDKCQPELDTSAELDGTGRSKYQSLIGILQWIVTLGRFDIACAVMTMSRFRSAPRSGHLLLLGNIFGYLRKYPDGALRFKTETPQYEKRFTPKDSDWENTVYGEAFEELPPDMPIQMGKVVRQSGMFDANLQHDLITGRSAMGTFHMVQGTVVHFASKRQSTVETATYATEFIAGRTCLDEAIAIRYELRMLGAPLDGPIWLFGDNKSMIESASEPSEGRLAKRHILSWHRLREKAAMKIVHYLHIESKENISDCLTKHLSHPQLWALIKEHLFYRWGEQRHVSFSTTLTDGLAPDGECQARNGIGPEQVVNNQTEPRLSNTGFSTGPEMMVIQQSEPWHSVYNSQCIMTAMWINGQCHVVPINLGYEPFNGINQDPYRMVWTEHLDGEVKPSSAGP